MRKNLRRGKRRLRIGHWISNMEVSRALSKRGETKWEWA